MGVEVGGVGEVEGVVVVGVVEVEVDEVILRLDERPIRSRGDCEGLRVFMLRFPLSRLLLLEVVLSSFPANGISCVVAMSSREQSAEWLSDELEWWRVVGEEGVVPVGEQESVSDSEADTPLLLLAETPPFNFCDELLFLKRFLNIINQFLSPVFN